ncbi:hypothetical protein QWZ13_18935 [Reinekea marina]|uniref:Uncharacterized protein n=1 Tax=Reinekea marina TaxID=1310421 RepID=A0ABV7WTR7_9GAMM|nr:hypothetical protein [Reinekea marina]MBU2864107.1 hypothetical protein [Reinekea forsetii]MDN3650989.1 hypothetical protein [Reinekea marina]
MSKSDYYIDNMYPPSRKSSSIARTCAKVFLVFLLIAGAATGGMWIVGALFGVFFGLLGLVLSLAPVIFTIWIIWLIVRAIVV